MARMLGLRNMSRRGLVLLLACLLLLAPLLFLITGFRFLSLTPATARKVENKPLTRPEPAPDADLDHDGIPDAAELRSVSGGWHTHADILEDRLRGQVPEAFWTRHAVIDALYRQRERNG